jgi:GNAT superfamily N-acetyltransferase
MSAQTQAKPTPPVRLVNNNEIPVMVEYRIRYLSELQGDMSKTYKDELRTELIRYFEDSIKNGRYLAVVAEQNGEIVSFGGMVIKEIPGDAFKTSYREGDILNMYTIPGERRKGFSSLILERLLGEAKKLGISKVALHTSQDGEKLYRNFHFTEPVYPYLERILK